MNWGLWWAQIKSVIRLEMRKTFFAKRGIWVYLLALAPAALFLAVFLACAVEAVEATTIVLAAGTSRDWRSALQGTGAGLVLHDGIVHCSCSRINGLAHGPLPISIRLIAASHQHAPRGHAYSPRLGGGDDSGGA